MLPPRDRRGLARLAIQAVSMCALGVPILAQSVEEIRAEAAALRARVVDVRADLAKQAYDLDLLRDAGTFVRDVVAVSPGHPIASLLDQLKGFDGETFAKRYRDALKKSGRKFEKATEAAFEPVAAEFATLAEKATELDPELAESLWGEAYGIAPESKPALAALKALDYVTIFNYGVLPKEERDAARESLSRVRGSFLSRKDLREELDFWTDAWGLETRHYRFVTNAPHQTVFAFAQACEDLFEAWEDFMKANKVKLRKLTRKCTVYLFASKVGYETILRVQGEEPIDSDSALGFYTATTKIGYFYDDPDFYAGDLTRLFETFYHEGAHQLFDLRMKGAWRGYSGKHDLQWVEEGICCYLESLQIQDDGKRREFTFGRLVDDDFANGIESCLNGTLMSSEEFVHCSNAVWDAYGDGYPHATLLSHFLIEGNDGKHSKLALDLLYAERTNGGLRKKSLFEELKLSPEELDAELEVFAKAAREQIEHRVYGDDEDR